MKIFVLCLCLMIGGVLADSHLSDKYLIKISEIYGKVHQIHKEFEGNKAEKDKAKFQFMITQIKVQKNELRWVKNEVNSVLSSLVSFNVLDKVYLEFARIMTECYSEALNTIAFEILGYEAGIITGFKRTYISDSLSVVTGLLKSRFDKVVNELADIDHRVTTIMEHKNTTSDLTNELKVLNELSKTIEESLQMKSDLYRTFIDEKEKVELEGQELDILQNTEVELHVLMLDWLVQFSRTYQDLIKRLIGK